ncbi:MAG: alpha/beta hydrolase, partial [Rhodanobacter sp.]
MAYGPDPLQQLDVYRPANPNGFVIFMEHGGGWRRGDKRMPNVIGNKLAHYLSLGYVFVSANYRLGEDITPLDQANDVAKALAFCQNRARDWGCAPGKFILMGHSAGAHLVALLASAPSIGLANGVRPWKGTICLDSAAYNVVQIMEAPHPALFDQAFGDNEPLWYAASPFHRLTDAPKPMLLVASILGGEETDRYENVEAFAAKVEQLGGKA